MPIAFRWILLWAASSLGAVAVANPPASAAVPTSVLVGERKPLGAGTVHSWLRAGAHGEPVAFGISFDDAALTALGDEEKEIALALPVAPGSPFRTAVIDWNPHGHAPAHVYDVPHFDFHFYTIDEGARMAIAPAGPAAAATPAPDIVPAGFGTDGSTVPMMGKHYVAGSQPEFNGGAFTATPIYGYYDGHLAFVESMVTVAYLQTKPELHGLLAQPTRFERRGYYPHAWGVTYDRAAHSYDIVFTALAEN